MRRLYEMGMEGDVKAIGMILHQALGKPSVAGAGKMVDDVVGDELEKRLSLLSPQELEAYMLITAKLQGVQGELPPPRK